MHLEVEEKTINLLWMICSYNYVNRGQEVLIVCKLDWHVNDQLVVVSKKNDPQVDRSQKH
jgi:hypothetical protein